MSIRLKIEITKQICHMLIAGNRPGAAIKSNNYGKKPYEGRFGNSVLPVGQRRDILSHFPQVVK